MENKQTQTFVRTAYDLERKWGLSSFPSTKKAVEQQKEQLKLTMILHVKVIRYQIQY